MRMKICMPCKRANGLASRIAAHVRRWGAAFAVLGLVAFAGASARAAAWSADWANKDLSYLQPKELANSDTWKTIYDVKGLDPASPEYMFGYTHGNAWQNSIDWAVRDPDDREKSIRKVVHYEFRPTAEGIAAWTSDAHEGYLTGFEDPNRVDYFAVALPQKTPLANPPAGRGLVVQLHGRCGGAAGDKSLSVIGSTDRPNSVFYAPADMYALSLECLENIFSDYWYGSMPPPETVNKASITLNAGAKVTHWDSKVGHALRHYSWEDMGMQVTEDVSRADYNGSAGKASEAYIISAYGFQGEIFSGPKKGNFAHYSRREDMTCIRWNSKESPVVRKLLDTIEWVVRKYNIDRNKIYITGNSMGGQGALALGMTHGEIFAAVNANVPATIWFAAARLGLVNEDGSDKPLSQVSQPAYDPPPVFDWSGSDDAWSRDHDVIYRNADRMRFHYQGWWGNYGHCDSVATAQASNDVTFVGVDVFSFAKNKPYAVFSGSNVNTPLPWPQDNYVDGDSGESEVPVSGGTEQASGYLTRRAGTPAIGQWNAFVKADIVTDSASKLEADLWIPGESELPTKMYERPEIAIANVSFRRLQNFPHGAGQKVRWSYAGGSGVMPLDRCNLFTVENAWMTGSKRRLTLVPTSDAVTPVGSVKVTSVAMSGATGTATVELNLVDKAGLASVPYAIEYATNESFSGAVAGPSGSLSNLGATSVSLPGLAKNQRYYLRAKLNNGATIVTTLFLVQGSNRTSVVPPTIPSQVYTGAALVPAVPTSADWTVLPNQSWTGAGTHKVKLQLTDPDHKKWSTDAANDVIEVDFVIEKADPKWTVEPKLSADSWKAGGTPATYTAGTVSSGATAFERYLADDWFTGPAEVDRNLRAFTGAFPTVGGCYKLIVKVPESANWKELVWEKRFTVIGRELTTVTDVENATDQYPIGNDTVLVFADPNADGSFKLTQATKVELLLVGGGGAGGCFAGGGGGAGGVLQVSSLVLPAGNYVAKVGLGGAKQRMHVEDGTYINGQGASGGDSILMNSVGSVNQRAVGGSGGGGCADINGGRWYPSVDGGSSGGCGAMFAPGYAKSDYSSTDGAVGGCVAGQGHMGGAGWGDSATAWGGFAGGGGGAGAAGEKGGSQASGHAGNGGDGILSAITGASLYWGAGGGGSMAPGDGKDYKVGWLYAMATSGGEGGKGGGGHGATARLIRSYSGFGGSPEKMAAVHAATGDGAFYGAGGGGGGAEGWYYNGFHGTENEWVLGYGGFGYQGIVIVRLTPYAPEPGHVHTYVETVETEPTCTVDGRKLVECVCGDKHYEKIPATGRHTPVTVPQVDPTCTAVGKTAWTKCSVCGQQLTPPSDIAMLPHFYVDGHCKSCGKEQSQEERDKKLTRDGLTYTGATVRTRNDPGFEFLEDDIVLIWTSGTGSFTINAAATARVLCVGGGGSGAQENTNGNAGGGGAGGFADFHNTFNAGTYTVTVGAGGAAVGSPNSGKPGTASAIVFDKLDIVRAEGGTGGVQGYPNPNTQPHGGNGGAVTHPYAITTDEIPVCGFEGAVKGGSNTGAGGAGASARGEGRKGGAGYASDITGELVEYAGGGGGGGHKDYTIDIPGTYGAGNSGGPSAATAARANSGAGGGAGAKVGAMSGAGGSGIVVVRFTLADHEHVWVNEKVVTPATCGADGLKTATCSVAGCSVVHYETIPATGAHNQNVAIPGVEATCTNEGWTAGAKCSVCGTVVVERQKIAMKDHTSVGYAAEESTCTQHGHEAGTRCSFCGVNLTGGAELPLAEHEPVDIAAVPASCQKTGFTAGTECKFCHTPLSGHEVVPLQPHQYGSNGKCTVCGHESHGLAGVTYSGATKSTVGTDILLVYDNPNAVGTLQLEDWMNAWVLVVGGGGSGANDHGNSWAGGGGGGGFVEERGFRLPSGSYTITVGKGGAGAAAKSSGNRGGDSSLVGAGVNLVGFGGGAGGYSAVGGDGGCGGGAGLQNKGGAASQGYSVDWASLPRGNSGTGGGGMGSAGTMGRISAEGDFPLYGGIGGDGKASWITGAEVLYGAGGGGAGQLGAGPGGAGGGGTGARGNTSDEEIKKLIQRGTAGKNGVGAGGGADNTQGTGCAGGSGVVIVRIVPDEGRTIVGIPEIANKVYNGSTQVATVPASAKYTVTSNAGGIHGGEYAVTLKLTDAAHDRWAGTAGDTVTVKWHITPATNKWTTKPTVTANSWLFGSGDTPAFPQPAAQFGNDTMKITYNGQAGAACWPSEPGVYRVTFTIPASSDVKELTGFVDVAMWDPLGPKIAVLGDSYSHHHDFSTWGDASYHNSYPTEAFGLTYVGDMWWAKLAQTLGGSAKSYAQGSCGYSYLGNNMDAAHASVAKDHSLIKQVDNLDPDTEVIILFAGLNDDYNTKISKKSDYADDWHLSKPWESNESLLNDLYPAVCCVCDKIKTKFPDADVFFVLSTKMYPSDTSTCAIDYQLGFQFGSDTLITKVAKLYFGENANVLQLLNKKSDPFTKQNGHPNVNGARMIYDQVLPFVQAHLTHTRTECAHPTTEPVAAVDATCTLAGFTAGTRCTVCGKFTSGHVVIPALGHQKAATPYIEAEAADCTHEGHTAGYLCTRCHEICEASVTIPALGHNYVSGKCDRCGADEPQHAKTQIAVPTAVGGLVYTGSSQTGVRSGTGYTVSGNTGTDAKSYTATAKLSDTANTEWADGTTADKQITWSIAKATNSWTTQPNLSKTSWTVGDAAATVTDAVAKFGTVTKKLNGAAYTAMPTVAGDYTLTWSVAGTSNYSELTVSKTFSITSSSPSGKTRLAIPSAVGGLAYTGEEQTGVNGGTGYTLTGNVGTDAKSYTATAKLSDTSTTEWSDGTTADKQITWSIAQAENAWTTEAALSKTSWAPGEEAAAVTDAVAKFGTVVKTLNGAAFAEMPTAEGKYTLAWTVAETTNYKGITVSKSFKIGASPSGTGIALDQIHWTNAETNWVGGDLVIQWTSGEGTLTLDAAATGRILCVGGGGGGGFNNVNGRAGGGGAGGFADFYAELSGGDYAITVGAGGAGKGYQASQDGGVSSVVSGGSDVVRSTGGKGGDSVDSWGQGKTSAGGDSGAATAPDALSEPEAILSVSHAGKVQPVGNNVGGGGAGASADGESRIAGDGYTSDITGEAVEYAGGGGGAGHKDYTSSLGGVFGGGNGGGSGGATSARANSGAGGGGTAVGDPGNGGSGIVVMRFTIGGGDTPPVPPPQPPVAEGKLPTDMPQGAKSVASGDVAGIAWTGAEKAWKLGTDTILVFTDVKNAGSFTVASGKAATVSYLAVGGGGAGGFGGSTDRIGAGGGAGGFCAGTDLALASGDYAIGVGAGGVPTTSTEVRGQNGGDSFVKRGETDLVRAIGGGAGGNGGATVELATGANGGCGGGGADTAAGVGQPGGTGTEGQGFAGGRAADGSGGFLCRNGGGGGGAGAVGSDSVDTWKGGDGGCGLASQITGLDVWYAGGGAGGVTTYGELKSVAGGKGGGGSIKSDTVSNPNEVYAEDGVDTLGGGGAASTGAYLAPVAPGRGGNGVVVIRVTKIEDVETPQEESPSVEGGEKIDFEKDMTDNTKVNSSKAVIFPSKPQVDGNVITYGGKTVEMPAYYKVSVVEAGGAWKLSLVLDAEAVRPEIDTKAEDPFVVDSEKVTLAIDNVKPNLYYGIESVTTLGPAAKWTPGTAVKGSELKDGSQLEANRPAGSDAAFFRVYVTDVPQKSN